MIFHDILPKLCLIALLCSNVAAVLPCHSDELAAAAHTWTSSTCLLLSSSPGPSSSAPLAYWTLTSCFTSIMRCRRRCSPPLHCVPEVDQHKWGLRNRLEYGDDESEGDGGGGGEAGEGCEGSGKQRKPDKPMPTVWDHKSAEGKALKEGKSSKGLLDMVCAARRRPLPPPITSCRSLPMTRCAIRCR